MPIQDGQYVAVSADDIRETMAARATELFGNNIDLTEYSIFNSIFDTVARAMEQFSETTLSQIYQSAFLPTAEGRSLERVVAIIGLVRRPAIQATGVVRFSRDQTATRDYVIQNGTLVQTMGEDPSVFETTDAVVLEEGTDSVEVNIRAIEGGTHGNVGSNSIVVMPSPPSGIHNVTNPIATGDDSLEDLNGNALVVGQNEETDTELRERAEETVTTGGDATHSAIVAELLAVPQVNSVTVIENKEAVVANDMPPLSFEAVVYGGTDQAIAQAIFDKKAVTSNDVGGIHGTETNIIIQSDVNNQRIPITFSRPPTVDIEIELDLVVTEDYIGNNDIRDIIVQYIGGTSTSGNSLIGRGVGQDVLLDQLTDRIVGNDTGVRGVSSISTTPSYSSNQYELDAVVLDSNEVGIIDGTDSSISINLTEVSG